MKFEFTHHSVQRMSERDIGVDEVERAVREDRIIAKYPNEKPYPSCLAVLITDSIPIHVVFSIEENNGERVVFIITVYRPDPMEWDAEYSKRRSPR